MEKLKTIFSKIPSYARLYYSHILAVLLILSAIAVVYWRDFEILGNELLNNEATSHVLLVPFLLGFLLYRSKDLIKASVAFEKLRRKASFKYLDEVIGTAVCLVALLLYWYGSYTFHPLEHHLLSLPVFVAGVILILFGMETLRVLIFPVLFLVFLVPPPTELMYTVGGAMANFTTQAAYTILKAVGIPVTLQLEYGPPTLALNTSSGPPIYFAIDLPCSGIYSLIAFLMFATFLAYIITAPVFKKAGIYVLGFLVFVVMNLIRITSIVSIGYLLGEEVAMVVFHTATGWLLILVGMLLVLFTAERLWKIQITRPPKEQTTCSACVNTTPSSLSAFCANCGSFIDSSRHKITPKLWAKLLLLLLGVYLVTLSIQAPTFVIAQGPEAAALSSGWENATNIFPETPEYTLKFLYRDTQYEKVALQDASLVYAYFPQNTSNPTIYVDVGVASTISNLHNWEVCLVTWQTYQGRSPLVSVLDSRDIQLLQDVPIIARYLVFESPANYTQVTLYWYEKATFHTGITVEQKYVRISLIILAPTHANYPELEDKLLPLAQSIAIHWEPIKSQSLISMGIPTQQLILAFAIGFVATTKTAQYTNEWRKRARNLKLFNTHASPTEKSTLEALNQLRKETKVIYPDLLASDLASRTGKNITHSDTLDTLNRLEAYGLARRDLVIVDGRPVLVWKP